MKESKQLYDQAKKIGLCEEYTNNWRGDDVESLCLMYKEGIHFCLEKGYPDVDFMVAKFRGKTEEYGVYISEIFTTQVEHDVYIINGSCVGKIMNTDYGVSKIYLRHDSSLKITAVDNSITYIDMYDDCELQLNIGGNAKVIVNKYGGVITGDIDKARIKLHIHEN